MSENENGWNKYQELVLKSLDKHDLVLEKISDELTQIKVETGQLKVKAGLWGAVAGAIPALTVVLFNLLK